MEWEVELANNGRPVEVGQGSLLMAISAMSGDVFLSLEVSNGEGRVVGKRSADRSWILFVVAPGELTERVAVASEAEELAVVRYSDGQREEVPRGWLISEPIALEILRCLLEEGVLSEAVNWTDSSEAITEDML